MALTLRIQKGIALTNTELDDNFIFLDVGLSSLQTAVDTLTNTTLVDLEADYNAKLALKQNAHASLTSLSNLSLNGLLVRAEDGSIISRGLTAGSSGIVITNSTGVANNPIIDIGAPVVTLTGTQILTNKNINGNSNTLSNISLTSAVSGVLPYANGGTNATTADQARLNLNAQIKPATNGIVVKTDVDSSVARRIAVSGVGLSITNDTGTAGDPTITSSATSANTPSTPVARDSAGNFSAGMITASLNGNALTVTNGVVTSGSYSNPAWITSLAGTKVTSIPNSSLQNSSITINGTPVSLGGNINLDYSGSTTNIANTNVKRDNSGNFSAGTITATLNGNASTSTSAGSAITAQRLVTPRNINGVAFDGTSDITVADNTKLPLSGGTLAGFLTLHSAPVSSMQAVNKGYVDSKLLTVTYGTVTINGTVPQTISPPGGKTMANLQGFLPALGSSYSATPTYSTNLIIIIDTSGSATSNATYNGVSYANAYNAGEAAGKFLVNYYNSLGPTNVCLINQHNGKSGSYKWTSVAGALVDLNNINGLSGTLGSVLDAYNNKPVGLTSQTILYFLGDANHYISVDTAFGSSESAWKTFLNTNKSVCYAVCVDNSGSPDNISSVSWDGRQQTDLNGFRATSDSDIPTAVSPGLFNTGSIAWEAKANYIEVHITDGSDVSNVAVNWLALWN
jgi:hypothetical protein